MSTLEKVSQRAVDHFKAMGGDKEAALDPAVLTGFMDIIMQLIQKIQECKANAGAAHQMVQKPSFLQRASVRHTVKEYLGSRSAFKQHGDSMVQALLNTGKDTTKEDMEQLYTEV